MPVAIGGVSLDAYFRACHCISSENQPVTWQSNEPATVKGNSQPDRKSEDRHPSRSPTAAGTGPASIEPGALSHELVESSGFSRANRLRPAPSRHSASWYSLRKMVAAVLVAELVDQEAVHLLDRPLLEPGVTEAAG